MRASFALLMAAATVAAQPRFVHVGAVAPDILEVVLTVGEARHGIQQPYVAQPDDRIEQHEHQRVLYRGGRPVGTIVGPAGDVFTPYDAVDGEGRDIVVDRREAWALASDDDPAHAAAAPPVAIHRKSKPTDLCRTAGWQFDCPVEHHVFLRLASPLRAGRTYALRADGILAEPHRFRFDPDTMRSEAVHVGQVGFAPDDPVKVAFISCWLGDGGALAYAPGLAFRVVRDADSGVVVQGTAVLAKAADDASEDAYRVNHNGVDVWRLEFNELDEPGVYRVVVDGIGCSFPFRIAADVWRDAFYVAARGFYHQRSGLELGPPFTEFRRPRPFYQGDGVTVFHSTCGLIDSGNGLGREPTNFGNLVAGKTDQPVADAWGGYMDAGDWDRRIQHLVASRYLLDLADRFPAHFDALHLNLPESGNNLPDIVDEALFGLDCYRRMQTPEGGIRGGIESSEHPNQGECSWQETLTVMAYAPDPWSSYLYAATAAQAARVVGRWDAALAAGYRTSAERAMAWAEEALPARAGRDDPHAVADARNFAAAELFAATGAAEWNELFRRTTVFGDAAADLEVWQHHEQREAAWTYACCAQPETDATLRANCRAALLREADDRLAWGQRTGFGWTKNPWAPFAWGALTRPPQTVARAWLLTGDPAYRGALVRDVQAQLGANPLNLCYTTGLGLRWPQNPLHLDSRHTGQPAPPGLTVFGPMRPADQTGDFGFKLVAPHAWPALESWPSMEAYFDVFWWPAMCEYTVQQPMADVAYGLGILAAAAAEGAGR